MLKITQLTRFRTRIFNTCRAVTLTVAATFSFTAPTLANETKITDVKIVSIGDGMHQITVTLEHADTGWDHYANRWDVLDEQGTVIASRELLHPHVNEQPFTRSLRMKIPDSVKIITIEASDSVHGTADGTVTAEVPRE